MAVRVSTVDEYVAALPDDVRPQMERIRRSIRAVVPDVGATISYSMPTFTLDGRPLVHVAAWKKPRGVCPLPERDVVRAPAIESARGPPDPLRRPPHAVPVVPLERVEGALVAER